MAEQTTAEQAVVAELRALRRRSEGLTTETIASAPTLCRLLGNGDPALAYTRFQHYVLDHADDRTVKAAAISLGLLSESEGVLGRLEDGGQELYIDQRQVRRLSDEGLARLAALISSNWLVEASPVLTLIVASAPGGIALAMQARHPAVIEMRVPEITHYRGDVAAELLVEWKNTEVDDAVSYSTPRALTVALDGVATSVAVTWRGEVWPKMEVRLVGQPSVQSVETLGNRAMLRLCARAVRHADLSGMTTTCHRQGRGKTAQVLPNRDLAP